MKIESQNGEIVIMYREDNGVIIANNILIIDKEGVTYKNISNHIINILDKFTALGYKYLCTNPPTRNPLLALSLIDLSNESRIFAGPIEIYRGTKEFDKYINFLKSCVNNHDIQCKVLDNKELKIPVYFSLPLNGPASPPFRYINYDENGDVIDITEDRPRTNTFDITDRFYPGDEKKFDINIVKNKKITVKRKSNG